MIRYLSVFLSVIFFLSPATKAVADVVEYNLKVTMVGAGSVVCDITPVVLQAVSPASSETVVPVPAGATVVCDIMPLASTYLSEFLDNTNDRKADIQAGRYTIENISAAHDLLITFAGYPVKSIPVSGADTYFNQIQVAYDAATAEVVIEAYDTLVEAGGLLLNNANNIHVAIRGGFVADFFENYFGVTAVSGQVSIGPLGSVELENIAIQ